MTTRRRRRPSAEAQMAVLTANRALADARSARDGLQPAEDRQPVGAGQR